MMILSLHWIEFNDKIFSDKRVFMCSYEFNASENWNGQNENTEQHR